MATKAGKVVVATADAATSDTTSVEGATVDTSSPDVTGDTSASGEGAASPKITSDPAVPIDAIITALLGSGEFSVAIRMVADEHLAQALPDLMREAMSVISISGDDPLKALPSPNIVDDAQVAANLAAQEQERAQAREKAEEVARNNFSAFFDGVTEPNRLNLSTIESARLLIDNSAAFSIDFSELIPIDHLSLQGEDVLLTHPAIQIGDGMAESFTVKGVVLMLQSVEGFIALRCPLPHDLVVGGGLTAQLSENSLLFRAAR
jgi:hypothetical protein